VGNGAEHVREEVEHVRETSSAIDLGPPRVEPAAPVSGLAV
jgi:hypothetical protein